MDRLEWAEFKELLDLKKALLQYSQTDGFYYLQFSDGSITYRCRLDKQPSDASDLDDFIDNYKDNGNRAVSPILSADRKQVVLTSMTNSEWHYEPRSLDFYTARRASLYNCRCDGAGIDDGTDYADAWLVFKDATGAVIARDDYQSDEDFQAALTQSCVRTEMFFEPTHDYDIFGATLNIKERAASRAYLWVTAVPDVPAEYGGMIPFMGGGLNLNMLPDAAVIKYDAKTSSLLKYNSDYHTNKLAMVVKHAVGEQIGVQIIYEFYKA